MIAVREKINLLENIATQIKTKVANFAKEIENYYLSEKQATSTVIVYTTPHIVPAGVDWQGLAYFPREEINVGGRAIRFEK